MKNRYINAKLIDNIPYCECGKPVGRVHDYYGATVNDSGNGVTGFVRYCSDTKCRNLLVYYINMTITKTTRHIYNREDVTVLKEK